MERGRPAAAAAARRPPPLPPAVLSRAVALEGESVTQYRFSDRPGPCAQRHGCAAAGHSASLLATVRHNALQVRRYSQRCVGLRHSALGTVRCLRSKEIYGRFTLRMWIIFPPLRTA